MRFSLLLEAPTTSSCRSFRRVLLQSRSLQVISVGALAFIGSATVGITLGIPIPRFHDEFAYLLASDTFSHGRLTNPTHPMWIHFESIHIINTPTYMSKYPPAQGFVLAVGQVLTGYPIIGVWLSVGVMCAAICWMLQIWSSPRWAIFGGVLSLIHPVLGIAGEWAQTYWGGAVAATGGALVLGGVRSVITKKNPISAILLGFGIVILANSRPYEGLVLLLPVAVVLLIWLFSKIRLATRSILAKILLPLCLVLSLTAAGMGYYNFRVTGSVFRMPYQVHEEAYATIPVFVWQSLRPVPQYYHETLRRFHSEYGLTYYKAKQSLSGLLKVNLAVGAMYFLFAGGVLAIPLFGAARILAAWVFRDRWAYFATLTYVAFLIGIVVETYSNLHYFAPIIPINYFFATLAMRLWCWHSPRLGKIMFWIIPLLSCTLLCINILPKINQKNNFALDRQRAVLLEQFKRQSGQHLILVAYATQHPFEMEWVYNEADIDAAKVVWARDMDLVKNCELIVFFKDRMIWWVEVGSDDHPVKLRRYPRDSCPA